VGANLQGANLWEANLQHTHLEGADLRKGRGLAQDQVNRACLDEATQLPEGLRKPAPCPLTLLR